MCIGSSHTQCYDDYWKKIGNTNYFFYDNRTFGYMSTFLNGYQETSNYACEPISNVSTEKFRQFINKYFDCNGSHCVDNSFSCKNASRYCYEVEHIIDKSLNGRYVCKSDSCNVNIFCNLVMSFGVWNGQLGTLQGFSVKDSYLEKLEVYTPTHMNNVIKCIEYCNPNCVC